MGRPGGGDRPPGSRDCAFQHLQSQGSRPGLTSYFALRTTKDKSCVPLARGRAETQPMGEVICLVTMFTERLPPIRPLPEEQRNEGKMPGEIQPLQSVDQGVAG